jgi:hypothetical protein
MPEFIIALSQVVEVAQVSATVLRQIKGIKGKGPCRKSRVWAGATGVIGGRVFP